MKRLYVAGIAALGASLVMATGAFGLFGVRASKDGTPPPKPSTRPLINEKNVVGSFYQGDGLGANLYLDLAADHSFKFRWRGCLGEYDRNEGSWQAEGDVVVLHPRAKGGNMRVFDLDVRLVPVKWGERVYLVDEFEMPAFAAFSSKRAPGLSREDAHGSDYVKIDRKFKMAKFSGKPEIPARFRDFYEQGAVGTKVKTIRSDGTVTLDKGELDRLRAGLRLVANEFSEYLNLEILSASAHEAVARPLYMLGSTRGPKIGEKFATGGMWLRPEATGRRLYASLKEVPRPQSKR